MLVDGKSRAMVGAAIATLALLAGGARAPHLWAQATPPDLNALYGCIPADATASTVKTFALGGSDTALVTYVHPEPVTAPYFDPYSVQARQHDDIYAWDGATWSLAADSYDLAEQAVGDAYIGYEGGIAATTAQVTMTVQPLVASTADSTDMPDILEVQIVFLWGPMSIQQPFATLGLLTFDGSAFNLGYAKQLQAPPDSVSRTGDDVDILTPAHLPTDARNSFSATEYIQVTWSDGQLIETADCTNPGGGRVLGCV